MESNDEIRLLRPVLRTVSGVAPECERRGNNSFYGTVGHFAPLAARACVKSVGADFGNDQILVGSHFDESSR